MCSILGNFISLVYMKKVNLYNKTGKLDTVYVFTGESKQLKEHEMFEDKDLIEIKKDKPKIIQVGTSIHDDDNIKTIKKKIVKAMNKNIALEELYLYYPEEINVDPLEFYHQITNFGKTSIYGYQFGQILFNTGFGEKQTTHIPYKAQYQYIDILSLEITKVNVYKPLGMEFSKHYDYNFSGNPFQILQTQNQSYTNEGDNVLMYMENQLYFNYFKGNTLYLMCAETLLDYCSINGLNQSYFIELYYPLLNKKNINNKAILLEQRDLLIKENQNKLKDEVFLNYENVDLLYSISKTKNVDKLKYIEHGIKYLSGILYSHKSITLPLENIFKNVHCDKYINIIKYNPGNKKENIYRVYTKTSSKTGKPIPYVSKQRLISVSKQTDKSHTITFHIRDDDMILNIVLDRDCNISFNMILSKGRSDTSVEKAIKTNYDMISSLLNNILLQVGFKVPIFTSLKQSNFEIKDIHYDISIASQKPLEISKCNSLFALIFDSKKESQNEIHINYKRVSNYKQMDAINKIIYDNYNEHQDEKLVIQLLIKHHNYTEKAAIRKMTEFFNDFNRIRGKYVNYNINIVEQPGFPTTLSYIPFDNEIRFQIKSINHVHYLQHINIYIDSLLCVLLYPEVITIPNKLIQQKCTETINIDDDNDNMVITNDSPISSVVPLDFVIDEDTPLDLDNEDGIIFDDEQEDSDDNVDDDTDGIFFDSDEDEDDMMEGGSHALDGQSLMNPNIFFKRLQSYDPILFKEKKEGKFNAYSRLCPFSEVRQPIIINDDEKKKIDKDHPGSYNKSISYSSDGSNKYHYICPRYWCLKTSTSLTQEQVDSGSCGKIIPPHSKTIPEGHYIYEFTSNHHTDSSGNYQEYAPGFLDPKKHPDGKCIPCCFKNFNKTQETREQQCSGRQIEENNVDNKSIPHVGYILSYDSFPIDNDRLGYLPPALARFLNIDYSKIVKNNPELPTNNTKTMLRIGSEQSNNKSFVGCLAEIHHTMSKPPGKKMSINDFCHHIANSISIDDFLLYNNGSLMSQFKTNSNIQQSEVNQYRNSRVYKSLNIRNNKDHEKYLNNVITSYNNFKTFLTDPNSIIDHTYMWDIVCNNVPVILNESINLIILEFQNNDITNNVSILCPTNSYSTNIFDEKKNSVLLYKNQNFYELITFVEQVEKNKKVDITQRINKNYQITEFFKLSNNVVPELNDVLKSIKNNINKCSPLPSNIKTYEFKTNYQSNKIVELIKSVNSNYKIVSQVVNYQGKTIGLMIKLDDSKPFYIPTYPSMIVFETQKRPYPIITMNDSSLWNSYKNTKMRLEELSQMSQGTILCKPRFKVIQDGLVVGILTITNQFIQIEPSTENIQDDLMAIDDENHIVADNDLLLKNTGNTERIHTIKKIKLETHFYNAFRNIIRILLHKSLNRDILEKITFIINYRRYFYQGKINKIVNIISDLIKNYVVFSDYEDDTILMKMSEIYSCFDNPDKKLYCLPNGDDYKLHIPRLHLVSGQDNKKTYLNRIADELIRNSDISQFLLVTNNVLRIPESNYSVNDKEFIILHSLLKPQYFDNLEPFSNTSYSKLNVYSNAQPEHSQYYSNKLLINKDTHNNIDCIEIVNQSTTNKWKEFFPKNITETVFKNIAHCTFSVIQNILKFENNMSSIIEIKNLLIRQYSKYEHNYSSIILSILSDQGKKEMITDVKQNKRSIEEIIMSDSYFISDLDIVMIFNDIRIPVALYCDGSKLKIYKKNRLLLLGNHNTTITKHHFIHTQNKSHIQSYSLLNSPIFLHDLSDKFNQKQIPKNPVSIQDVLAEYVKK